MEYYLAIKENEILGEISQKDKYYMISLVCVI